jgi:hypothetical protein
LQALKAQDARQDKDIPTRVVRRDEHQGVTSEEDCSMKKSALLSVIAFLTFLPVRAQAQNTDSSSYHNSNAVKSSKKTGTLSGEVGGDGKTLTADNDGRIWKVSNPETLRGIDARHVRVRAHVDSMQGRIQVLSVSAIVERSGIKLDDAAFRR